LGVGSWADEDCIYGMEGGVWCFWVGDGLAGWLRSLSFCPGRMEWSLGLYTVVVVYSILLNAKDQNLSVFLLSLSLYLLMV